MLLVQSFDPKNYRRAETISADTRVLIAFGPYIEEHFPGLVTESTPEAFTVELDDAEHQGTSTHYFQQADSRVYVDEDSTQQWAALSELRQSDNATFAIDLKPGAVSMDSEQVGSYNASWWIQYYGTGGGSAGTSSDRRTAIADMYEAARTQGHISENNRYLSGNLTITCPTCRNIEHILLPSQATAIQVWAAISNATSKPCDFCTNKEVLFIAGQSRKGRITFGGILNPFNR